VAAQVAALQTAGAGKIAANVFNRSRVDRASRSSRVTHQHVAGFQRGNGLP
jgi:hypothetical protein